MTPAQSFPVLIRREFWEHRSLWITPAVIAGLFLLLCLVPGGINPVNVHIGRPPADDGLLIGAQVVFTAVLFAIASIVLFFYLTDCLYAERKDRSILFWKSLPVSDSATVLSKVAVALFVVPLAVYVLAVIAGLLGFGILWLRLHGNAALGQYITLDPLTWARVTGVLGVDALIISLWYAPLAGYQLLVSAWAKSSPFVWTILPPIVLSVGEGVTLHSWNIRDLILSRLLFGVAGVAQARNVPKKELLMNVDAAGLTRDPEFWIGLAVAAVLVFAAIRIRRYRDDN